MSIKVAINGFGRIGRNVFKIAKDKYAQEIDFVHINDLTDATTLAHLLKYDSVHGKYDADIQVEQDKIIVNGDEIDITAIKDPAELPWQEKSVDVVIESTGAFRYRKDLNKHLDAGAKKVLLSVPAKDEIDGTIVLGVNDDDLTDDMKIVSNASCTTNCLAPVVKVLNDKFGIKNGLMTTIHAYTNDQKILDMPHKDLRRARAAAVNIIPTTTGAAKAVGMVIPELRGKLNGCAMRVPIKDGSIVDLVANLNAKTTVEEINSAIKEAAENELKGILQYSNEPLVSTDIIDNPHSSIFDSEMTMMIDTSFVKVVSWYDNEWGYSNRMVDLLLRLKV